MDANRKRPLWVWAIAFILALPVLYVLSSGPMISVAGRRHVYHKKLANGRITAHTIKDPGAFWVTFYTPLVWSANQSWGEPLGWYWDQFPVRGKYGW